MGHPRSLISTFVVRCLDYMLYILALSQVSRFLLVSVAEQAGLNLTWSKVPEDTFSRDVTVWLISCFKGNSGGVGKTTLLDSKCYVSVSCFKKTVKAFWKKITMYSFHSNHP